MSKKQATPQVLTKSETKPHAASFCAMMNSAGLSKIAVRLHEARETERARKLKTLRWLLAVAKADLVNVTEVATSIREAYVKANQNVQTSQEAVDEINEEIDALSKGTFYTGKWDI